MGNKKSWNDEPAIQQKEYTQEEYNKKKQKSFKFAKTAVYLGELMAITGWNIMISLLLFLVMLLGTSALPYIMDINIVFTPETFWCRGGIFIYLCAVFLVLFTIIGFNYAIIYKIVEIMCIHLDGGLEGAMEVNDAAMRANLKGQMAKTAGLVYVDAEALAGPMRILTRYCVQNNVPMVTPRFFKILHRVVVVVQILLACSCFFVLLQY